MNARLAGAAEAIRQKAAMPILDFDAALLERFLGPVRAAIARHEWDAEFGAGRALSSPLTCSMARRPMSLR